MALNDEIFEIRELAMCTIGRLSNLNPAYVMPSLRKTLIQVRRHSMPIFILFLGRSNLIILLSGKFKSPIQMSRFTMSELGILEVFLKLLLQRIDFSMK